MSDAAELQLLRDSVRGVLSKFPDALDLTHGDDLAASTVSDLMAMAAAQGWTAMLLPEEMGGLGLGMREAAVVSEEVGRSLAPGPLLANAALIPSIAAAAESGWLADIAGAVAAGDTVAAFCVVDEGDGRAARHLVEHPWPTSTVLRLSTTREGLTLDHLGTPPMTARRPLDPTCPIAELAAGTPYAIASAHLGVAASAEVVGAAQLWIAAELLGLALRAGEMSVSHAGTRRQFGQPIGANQAIKHRIVDDYMLRQNAAAIIAEAAEAWDARRTDRMILVHAARAAATAAAMASTAHCIQVHGAIGFSAESTVHLAYKRVRRLACTLGDEMRSRSYIAEQLVSGLAA